MATRAKKKTTTTTIPSFRQLEKQVGRLRKDLERTVDRVSRQAVRYLPTSSQRQINELIDKVENLGGTVTKRVTKTVETVRADVEDSVGDLRGTVDKRVKALTKDAAETSQKALQTLEKETRKQFDRLLKAVGLPLRSDVDGIKRRLGTLERRIEDLIESSVRRRGKSDESQAA